MQSSTSRRRAFALFYADPRSPSFLVGGKSYQRAFGRPAHEIADRVAYSAASRLLTDVKVKHDVEAVAEANGIGIVARIAHRSEIARGDARQYTREIQLHPDGGKTLTLTEEEPRIKDRLNALDQLDRVTGHLPGKSRN